jgi:hypothetical protein
MKPRRLFAVFSASATLALLAAVFSSARADTGPAASPEEIAAERERFVKELTATIAGHEKDPAESVFKNIKSFKGMPAGRLLTVMNMGFSRSLGVSCTHCHNPEKWDSDEKRPKQVARDMKDFTAKINGELLPAVQNLESKKPFVTCTTCHRGDVKPATDLGKALR